MQATVRQRTIRRQRERAGKATASAPSQKHSSAGTVAFSLLLIVVTIVLYTPVRSHDFLNYDDDVYVYHNTHVTVGLTWQAIRWSLTATEQSNWHPVTWLSHALDCQLFGLDSGYHHLSNVVIHALNVLLLFLLLQQATGAVGCSFLVAALFAWHPFNVGSVAWVAERKNLLSTFFFFLTLGAYGWYARKPEFKRMLAVVGVFVLALAAKPMAVSLPFVLVLLDYWPLQRVASLTEPSPRFSVPQQPIERLFLEKVPLFALSAASSAITIWAQRSGAALRSLHAFPLGARLGNALYSYAIYVWKAFWPSGFAVYYPHPGTSLPLWKPALAAVLLCSISVEVWMQRTVRPYLIVGWLWFLGSLLPVIGIVQVGDQAMADRYAYLPLVGLFVMVVWGLAEFLNLRHVGTILRRGFAVAALGTAALLTFQQLDYWQDSVSIWSHTVKVTPENALAEKQLASALVVQGDSEEAMPHMLNVARLNPNDLPTHVNIGVYYAAQGRTQDATEEFEKVVELTDHGSLNVEDQRYRASSLLDLGFAYALAKDYPRALMSFQKANQSNPAMVDQTIESINNSLASSPSQSGYIKQSLLLRAKGKDKEAPLMLEEVVKANPDYSDTRELLNYLTGTGK